jgi:hypothetical protein
VNGIHHGDISLNNLMYAISKTGDPVGIVNDFDLAAWIGHLTSNIDRTGTIPFMAIDLLDGGLDRRIPRLYRHDLESFCWVLAFTTVADIEYQDCTIKVSPVSGVNAWFRDGNQADRASHIESKHRFHPRYGRTQPVHVRYYRYLQPIQRITQYWSNFHDSKMPTQMSLDFETGSILVESVGEPEVDDPTAFLKAFVTRVEELLEETGAGEGFVEVRTRLLQAVGTPVVNAVNNM